MNSNLKMIVAGGGTGGHFFPAQAICESLRRQGVTVQYMGSFPAFMAAWGPIDQSYGAGQGVKCYHSEHLYGELWHRAFTVSPDTPRVNYIINCGNNVESTGGVIGVWRGANARARGVKRVQVEPHLSVTGAVSAEWVPIKPKTDAAFLYALLHRMLIEQSFETTCDLPHLKKMTNFFLKAKKFIKINFNK